MKNLIIVVIAFLSINAIAQEKDTKVATIKKNQTIGVKDQPASSAARAETNKLMKQLNLASNQMSPIYEAMLVYYNEEINIKKKINQLMATQENIDKVELKKEVSKNRELNSQKLDNKLKSILTSEQYKNYQQSNLTKQKSNQKVRKLRN